MIVSMENAGNNILITVECDKCKSRKTILVNENDYNNYIRFFDNGHLPTEESLFGICFRCKSDEIRKR